MDQSLGFKIERATLVAALTAASRVTERRNTIPILSNVLFLISRDKAELVATDLDMELRIELPVASESSGRLTVELKALLDAAKKFKGEFVQVADMGGGKASLSDCTSGAIARLGTRSPDDFPVIKPLDSVAAFYMPSAELARAIALPLSAASIEETRYYLQGVFIHATSDNGQAPDVLRFAATDGHRLIRITRPLPDPERFRVGDAGTIPDVILPRKACKVLGSIIGKKPAYQDTFISISPHGARVTLQHGRHTLITKAIDGSFPDYSRVIPTTNANRLTVPAGEFGDAVAGVAAICNEKTRAVTVSLISGEPVILAATSPENGTSAAIVESAAFEPDPCGPGAATFGANAAYVIGLMKPFGDSDVTFNVSDAAGPIRIESKDQPDVLIVLMPMRVDSPGLTRAEFDRLNMNPLQRLQADVAKLAAAVAAAESEPAHVRSHGRRLALRALGLAMSDAVDHIAAGGTERALARSIIKGLVAVETGDDVTYQRSLAYSQRLKAAREAVAEDPAQDPAPVEQPAPMPSEAIDAEPIAEPVADAQPLEIYRGPSGATVEFMPADYQPATAAEPEPVEQPEAEPVADEPIVDGYACSKCQGFVPHDVDACPHCGNVWTEEGAAEPVQAEPQLVEPVDVVKVLTLTDQAVFVAAADWADESISTLARYHRDGFGFYGNNGQRTVLRSNIKRLVPPRNRGDRPIASAQAARPAPAAAVDSDVAARLEALERTVAALTGTAEPAPKRSEARMRGIRAYLQLRAMRTAIAVEYALVDRLTADKRELGTSLSLARGAYEEAKERANVLQVRCDALERLHAASAPLDTAAAGLNGQPAKIILPVSAGGDGLR